jgi:hypothetical protein
MSDKSVRHVGAVVIFLSAPTSRGVCLIVMPRMTYMGSVL